MLDDYGYEYNYNPCTKFNDETHAKCKNVYVSAYRPNTNTIIFVMSLSQVCQAAVGTQSNGFVVGNGGEQIYQNGKKYYIRYTTSDAVR